MANFKKIITHIIILIILINKVTLINTENCRLSLYHLRNEWRVILKYDQENLTLLREPIVQNGTILYMVCYSDDITEITCINGEFNPPLPLEQCHQHMRPQLKLEHDRELCDHNLYRLGYQIQCMNNNYFFETYKVCFDYEHKRAEFTINEAYPFVMPRPQGMMFDPDEIFSINIFACYNKRNIFDTFQRTLGNRQNFMPDNAGDTRFDRGHLTPVADYMTNTLIATTFKMINVIPQFHTINDGNWKTLEEWARNPFNTPAKVCSGAFNWILELPDQNGYTRSMYLGQDIIPIPLWTYKIVLNRDGLRTVFLQYNNIHDQQIPPEMPYNICQEIKCPSNIQLIYSNYYGFTFCCNPEHFMKNSVPNLRGYC